MEIMQGVKILLYGMGGVFCFATLLYAMTKGLLAVFKN